MLVPIAILAVSAVLAFFVVLALKSGDFNIARSKKMEAAPAEVFAHVNNLRRWEAWSPWAKLDPNMKQTYAGPEAGEGASQSWDGNNKVGAGKLTVLTSRPSELIVLKLEFLRPMVATNTATFTFRPEAGGTLVTWSMDGCNGLMGKVFSMIMNMDKMIGNDFDKGLTELKAIVEKQPAATH